MRIVVSGTHASGRSTLVPDFALRHAEFTVLPDPFELIDGADVTGDRVHIVEITADRTRWLAALELW